MKSARSLAHTRPTAVNLFWAIERMRRLYAELQAPAHRRNPCEADRRSAADPSGRYRHQRMHRPKRRAAHSGREDSSHPLQRRSPGHCRLRNRARRNSRRRRFRQKNRCLRRRDASVPARRAPHRLGTAARPYPRHFDHRQHGRPLPAFRQNWLRGGGRRSHRRQWRCRQQNRHLFRRRAGQRERRSILCRRSHFNARPDSLDGDQIPIEQRAADEVTHVHGVPVAPDGTTVENPAFDVTPNRYVTAIVTERGVARPPYSESLRKLVT